jgi:O-acetyl-ADP-ribose deacetylase (regulator of RNase III)
VEIEYVTGDILQGSEEYLLHSCNSRGIQGSGIAKLLRDTYPENYRQYRRVYEKQNNSLDLGQCIWVDVGPRVIINGIGQENFGRDPNMVYVSYDAIQKIIQTIDDELGDEQDPIRVAMPLIGAGLGGGSWKIISEIIEDYSTGFIPVVYLLDGVIPEG